LAPALGLERHATVVKGGYAEPVMTDAESARRPDHDLEQEFEHPRGTWAIVLIFGALFAAGWFAMYIWLFLGRGAPRP
jgi:hypothetical protein